MNLFVLIIKSLGKQGAIESKTLFEDLSLNEEHRIR